MKPWTVRSVAALVVATVGVLAAQQWSTPSGAWSCDEIVSCTSTVALDLDALDIDDPFIGWRSFDLSPDGTEVVLALVTSEDPFRNDDRLLIGTFSIETGELLQTLVSEESVEFVSADEVRYSPDGTLIAAVWYQQVGQLQVFDASSGQLVATVIQNDDLESIDCSGALALSASNDAVQCGSAVWELATGEIAQTEQLFADSMAGSSARTASGLIADGFGQTKITIERRNAGAIEPVSVVDPPRFAHLDRSLHAFASTTSGVDLLVLLEDAKAWRWADPRPRRLHAGARLSIYNVDTGDLAWSAELADRTSGLAVGGQGTIATISPDGFVMIFDLEAG